MSVKSTVVNENISFLELVVIDTLTLFVAFIVEVYITGMGVKRKKVFMTGLISYSLKNMKN